MAVRGRGTSSAPQDVVETSAQKIGVDIPGSGDERANRLAGLGPLSGVAIGTAVGAVAGVLHRALNNRKTTLPAPIALLLIGAAAMALADVP